MRRRSSSCTAGRSSRSRGATSCRCSPRSAFARSRPTCAATGARACTRRHEDYAQEQIVADMIELLDSLGAREGDLGRPRLGRAGGVEHGAAPSASAVTASPACACPTCRRLHRRDTRSPLSDRKLYPEDKFPAAQWDYQLFYRESFDGRAGGFEANVRDTVKALFRSGDPGGQGQARAHRVRSRQRRLVRPRRDRARRAARSGRAHRRGREPLYRGARAQRLLRPGQLVHERARPTPTTPRAPRPAALDHAGAVPARRLRLHLRDASTRGWPSRCARTAPTSPRSVVQSGHWMAQEKPMEVNAALAKWLGAQFPQLWPPA